MTKSYIRGGVILTLFLLFGWDEVGAQTKRTVFALDENSVVKDSTGRQISKIEFYEALISGNFQFKPIRDKTGEIIEFLLIRCDKKSNNTKLNVVSNSSCAPTVPYAVGMLAPDFSGRDLSDTVTYDFNFFKGRKVVVLHFWFTKCKPCIDELPDMNRLRERYKDRADIVFIAPTFEFKEPIDEFLAEHPFNYAILPEAYEAIKNYKVTAYPLNIIIDFDGRIAYISAGGMPGLEYLMDKKIRELLGMK
ncbi:MAG: TlpA disulfide reductase family protein [Chitinophagales bacterium]